MSSVLLFLAVALLVAGIILYVKAERQRRTIGLPSGEVIYADVGTWRQSEHPLRSQRYGLVGKPDYLVDTADGIVPVEVKSTSLSQQEPYLSHKLQLAAYCLLVEDNTGRRPPYGIIHYANTTVRLTFNDSMRTALLDTLAQMRLSVHAREIRRSHEDANRCLRCGYIHACGQQALTTRATRVAGASLG